MTYKIKSGDKFNKLTVLEETHLRKQRNIVYKCVCECGNITFVTGTYLRKGLIKSCGCLQKERASESNKTHGKSHTKLYYIWQDMRKRCDNKNHHAYKYYGERGITYCNDWKNYENFYNWAINNGYKIGLTIDRIDNNGNYEPNNCRWVTMEIQNRNKRKTWTKPVNMYSLDKNFIKSYNSIKEACKDNNIKGTGISLCCKHKQKTSYGYIWEYAENNENGDDIE